MEVSCGEYSFPLNGPGERSVVAHGCSLGPNNKSSGVMVCQAWRTHEFNQSIPNFTRTIKRGPCPSGGGQSDKGRVLRQNLLRDRQATWDGGADHVTRTVIAVVKTLSPTDIEGSRHAPFEPFALFSASLVVSRISPVLGIVLYSRALVPDQDLRNDCG